MRESVDAAGNEDERLTTDHPDGLVEGLEEDRVEEHLVIKAVIRRGNKRVALNGTFGRRGSSPSYLSKQRRLGGRSP